VYAYAHGEYFPPWDPNVSGIVASIWQSCLYTAPVALSWIAPEKSYEGLELQFLKAAIFLSLINDNLPGALIKIGIESLRNSLELPLGINESIVYYATYLAQNMFFYCTQLGDKYYIIHHS